jgi:hypothetical protein
MQLAQQLQNMIVQRSSDVRVRRYQLIEFLQPKTAKQVGQVNSNMLMSIVFDLK